MALTEIDRALLNRCVNREAGAWNDFVDRFMGLFVHVIQHVAHSRSVQLSPEDIDDLCAEIFLKVLEKDFAVLRRFEGRSSLATYLSVIGRRIVVKEIAQRRKAEAMGHVNAHQASIDKAQAEQLEEEARIENKEVVKQMLDGLAPREREVVKRYHLAGESYQQISSGLKIPMNTVGPTLSRAREKLREQHAGS